MQERVTHLLTKNYVLWIQVVQHVTENQTLHEKLVQSQKEKAGVQAWAGPQPLKQDPWVLPPELSDGNSQKFRGFLRQCHLLFLLCPRMDPTDQTSMGFASWRSAGLGLHPLEQDSLVFVD